jgi:hypothetical protein
MMGIKLIRKNRAAYFILEESIFLIHSKIPKLHALKVKTKKYWSKRTNFPEFADV